MPYKTIMVFSGIRRWANHFWRVVPYLFGKFNYVVSIDLMKLSMHHVQFLCLIIFFLIKNQNFFCFDSIAIIKKYPTLVDSFFMFLFLYKLIAKRNCDIFCI